LSQQRGDGIGSEAAKLQSCKGWMMIGQAEIFRWLAGWLGRLSVVLGVGKG